MRIFLAVLAFSIPIFIPGLLPLIPIMVCSVLVYDGFSSIFFWRVFLLALLFELMWGIPLGSYMIAFTITALLYRVLQKSIAITPWAAADGWSMSDFAKHILIGTILSWGMTSMILLVPIVWYAYGNLALRFTLLTHTAFWWYTPLYIGVLLILLRRIQMPFRRRLEFGI